MEAMTPHHEALKSAAHDLYEALADVRLILVILITQPPLNSAIRLDDLVRFRSRVDAALAKARGE